MSKTRTVTETEELAEDEHIYPEHPLFPLEEGEKTKDVSWILVSRVEEGVQKYGPNIPANELLTEQDIVNRWGGGHYILIGRGLSKTYEGMPGRFNKHRRLHLPGNSKPLSPDPTPQEQRIASPNTPPANTSPMGDPMSFFAMMMQMQQQSLERERQASEKAQQQNQQFMQMFMTIMQGSKQDAAAMTQVMMQMSAQNQQSMMQFVSAMMASRGGGPEEMAKYADLLKTLGIGGGNKPANGEGGSTSESIGAMLENAADFVQGLAILKGSAPPPQPVAVDANTAPMGGASALLRGMAR